MTIPARLEAYHGKICGDFPGRYRSWEHCYSYFRQFAETSTVVDRRTAALQLGFYLASWGMYRGSSFLLQHDFTVHIAVVDALCNSRFKRLWALEAGLCLDEDLLVPLTLDAADAIRKAYKPYGNATDTLVTKVLLGTLACVPAVDSLFIAGFKSCGFKYSYLNRNFLCSVINFCGENREVLQAEQARIYDCGGVHYPFMKLVDMYFWQIGYER